MFRLLPILILSGIAIFGLPHAAVAKYASIVVEAESGRVLHAVNADTKNYPASLTKIMTLFMTFDALKDGTLSLDQALPVSRVAEGRSPSKLGLRRGETIRVRHAIAALVTKSANDVATVLAEALGGTERKFARMMTIRARQLGMTNTTFKNASGLPNRGQLSTARDMAILARAMLFAHPRLYENFSRESFTWNGRSHQNHNKLMRRYEGMDGIKTGYIRASGFNLVASAKRDGTRLIGVVFGGKSSRSRDRHMARLLDRGFQALPTLTASAGLLKSASVVADPPPPPRPRDIERPQPRQARAAPPPRPRDIERARATRASATPAAGENGGSASAPQPPAVRPAPEGVESWAIQVGAYNRYAPAHLAVTRAARAVPSLLGKKFKIVRQRSTVKRGLKIYKARLLVASESTARRSCDALKRRNIDCMVIWMGPPPQS